MKESRLYSFIDNTSGFTLHFLEATKLISDLEEIHDIGPNTKEYYSKTVITAQQMITFLKPGESLGIYIDSEDPYFRFKMETNFTGSMRTLLLPEEFSNFPSQLTGVARVSKIFPSNKPYTSIVKMENDSPEQIINNILQESYQTKSKIITSPQLNQSTMVTKLPKLDIKKVVIDTNDVPLDEYILKNNKMISDAFNKELSEIQNIVDYFESFGLSYLHSKEIKFKCPCSSERMKTNILTLANNDIDHLFQGDEKIEIRCDYCNSNYSFKKEDLHNI